MPKGKHQSHRNGTFALLHEFAGDVVDCGNVVGINRVTKAKTVSKESGAQKQRIRVKYSESPEPNCQIEHKQHAVYANYFGSGIARFVVEQNLRERWHSFTLLRSVI